MVSSVYKQMHEKIINVFKNKFSLKIIRDLHIASTVRKFEWSKESGWISVFEGQECKPKLTTRDLQFLRHHSIKNHYSSISDITTWARDYFGKPTMQSYIHKFHVTLNFTMQKRNLMLTISRSRVNFSGLRGIWNGQSHSETWTMVTWISIPDLCAPDLRYKRPSRLLPATSLKGMACHGMGLL